MGIKNRLFQIYFSEFLAARAIRRLPASTGLVLMYHEVLPDEITLPAWTIVRESEFKWQMCYLQSHFDVVTMDEALERVAGKSHGERPFAVVTFDDGYKGNLDCVLPIMESLGLPFLVYVATQAIIENNLYWYDQIINLLGGSDDIHLSLELGGKTEDFKIPHKGYDDVRWVETQRLLSGLKLQSPSDREATVKRITAVSKENRIVLKMVSEQDLQRLARSGCVSIGAHTHRHELLDQLSPEEVMETLRTSNDHITRITGSAPRHFAFPNGNYDKGVIELIQKAGYKSAVTTFSGFWSGKNSAMMIPRFGVGRFDSKGQFIAKISGYL